MTGDAAVMEIMVDIRTVLVVLAILVGVIIIFVGAREAAWLGDRSLDWWARITGGERDEEEGPP